MNTINHLDLFSGVGGFSLGLREAGVQVGWHGFSDIDKYANKVFKERFPDAKELGSIEHINIDKLPRIDLVTFGFPCQDLSIAGRRKGFDGSRSSLFFKAIEIIERKKPKYFVFENVKGFYSSNAGKDFTTALQTVADIGYDGGWQLLNTRWFLPQNRERIYFVGHIRGECRPEIFPVRENGRKINKSIKKTQASIIDTNYLERDFRIYEDASPTINARDYKDPKLVQVGVIGKDPKIYDTYNKKFRKDGICGTLTKETAGRGDASQGFKVVSNTAIRRLTPTECERLQGFPDGCGMGAKTGLYEVRPVLTPNRENKRQNGRRFKEDGEDMFTLTSQDQHGVSIGQNIRRLTPTECERLQGFPDGWTEGQSDTQRYKQMGNAVSVPVVKSIMEKLYK